MADRLRAPVQWYGGKGNMLAKLRQHVPLGGRPYCEPYMGAASLLFARPPAPVEVVNDLDGDLVNLFRCLPGARATHGTGLGESARRGRVPAQSAAVSGASMMARLKGLR